MTNDEDLEQARQQHQATMTLLRQIASDMNIHNYLAQAEAIADMGGEYIEFTYRGRQWAAAYGENCQLTGNADEDVWAVNTYDDREPFVVVFTPLLHTADAHLVAYGLLHCIDAELNKPPTTTTMPTTPTKG